MGLYSGADEIVCREEIVEAAHVFMRSMVDLSLVEGVPGARSTVMWPWKCSYLLKIQ